MNVLKNIENYRWLGRQGSNSKKLFPSISEISYKNTGNKMKEFIIYHNPRCSKSREALEILQEKNCSFKIVEYLKEPLSELKIKVLLKQLQLTPIDIIRTKEKCFSEIGLSKTSTDVELIKAMVENPILLERPIITDGKKAVIGRPPENVLKLL